MTGLKAVTRAQALGFLRDKQTLFWTLAFPLMFLLLFGFIYKSSTPPKFDVIQVGDVALFDQMPPEAKDAVDQIFTIEKSDDQEAAIQKVKDGDADVAVSMEGTKLIVYFSSADQVSAATIQGTLDSFVQAANQAVSGTPPVFTMEPRQVEDTRLKPIQFLAPGLLGWAVAFGAVLNAAMPFVQWRTTKMLRRLRLSPVSISAVIGSRALITIVVALVQIALFLGLGVALFDLRLTGWWWLAIPFTMIATLAFMSIGLLVGAVSKTPDGASGLANVIILPMAFMSGSFIPLDIAPTWMTSVSNVMPLKHLNEGLMDVLVRGQGVGSLLLPTVVLIGFGVVVAIIAARLFKWDTNE